MSIGMRCVVVAAAVLCGSLEGCKGPYCPKGYDQVDDTCYRRKDAGALDAGDEKGDTSRGDDNDAGDDDVEPEMEPAADDAGQEQTDAGLADAGQEEAGASQQREDASVTPPGDAATSCIPSAEVCDGKDNDCDGRVDEETPTWYCDGDGDGFAANATGKVDSCEKPAASASCGNWTTKAPSGPSGQDCDDSTGRRVPGAGFGLAVGSNGDLNCDGETETRLEFVGEAGPIDFFSGATRFNICGYPQEEVLGSGDADKCNCWLPYALVKDFVKFDPNGAGVIFGRSGDCCAVVPYYMQTFPCSEYTGDVILLRYAGMLDAQCTAKPDGVAVRQLCR